MTDLRMYLLWSSCTLYLLVCQARITVATEVFVGWFTFLRRRPVVKWIRGVEETHDFEKPSQSCLRFLSQHYAERVVSPARK